MKNSRFFAENRLVFFAGSGAENQSDPKPDEDADILNEFLGTGKKEDTELDTKDPEQALRKKHQDTMDQIETETSRFMARMSGFFGQNISRRRVINVLDELYDNSVLNEQERKTRINKIRFATAGKINKLTQRVETANGVISEFETKIAVIEERNEMYKAAAEAAYNEKGWLMRKVDRMHKREDHSPLTEMLETYTRAKGGVEDAKSKTEGDIEAIEQKLQKEFGNIETIENAFREAVTYHKPELALELDDKMNKALKTGRVDELRKMIGELAKETDITERELATLTGYLPFFRKSKAGKYKTFEKAKNALPNRDNRGAFDREKFEKLTDDERKKAIEESFGKLREVLEGLRFGEKVEVSYKINGKGSTQDFEGFVVKKPQSNRIILKGRRKTILINLDKKTISEKSADDKNVKTEFEDISKIIIPNRKYA